MRTLRDKQASNGRTLALNGAAWRRLRAVVLSRDPLCPECRDQGLIVPAVDVDHRDNDPSNNDTGNLVGLCKAHHSLKTNHEMGNNARWGCDDAGMPLDPHHAWNNAARARLVRSEKSPAVDSHEPPLLPVLLC